MHATIPLDSRAGATEGDLLLPRPPGVIRRFWARHPWVTDSIVAAIYLLLSSIALALQVAPLDAPRTAPPAWSIVLQVLIVLAVSAALVFRRRRPILLLIVAIVGTAAIAPLTGSVDPLALPLALYAVAVYRSSRDAWIGLAISIAGGTLAAYLALFSLHEDVAPYGASPAPASSQFAILMFIAVLIGVNVGNRKRYVAALVERAEQLARERDQQAIIAAAGERSRIAREMHDIVSHSLTVMVTLADGSAAATASNPTRASEGMRRVAETGRTALGDMRRMLGVLGTADHAEFAPQPGTGEITELLDTFRAAGLPVTVTTSGTPPDDTSKQLVIFRIVQESLTNALRHAVSPTSVSVELHYNRAATTIRITNDGGSSPESSGAGHGLIGMRERVALYGGTLETGPRQRGGWNVLAVLPHDIGKDSTHD